MKSSGKKQRDAPVVSSPAEAKKSFRVLVVDDSPEDLNLTTIHLNEAWPFRRRMEVDAARAGAEALEKLNATRFALLVLDWNMPGLGGSDVLRTLRNKGVRTPIIIVSGLQREDIEDDLDALGAAFVNKVQLNSSTLHGAITASLRMMGMSELFLDAQDNP